MIWVQPPYVPFNLWPYGLKVMSRLSHSRDAVSITAGATIFAAATWKRCITTSESEDEKGRPSGN